MSNVPAIITSRQVRANKRHNAAIIQNLILPTQDGVEDQENENEAQQDEVKTQEVENKTNDNESIEDKYQKLLIDHEKLKTKYKNVSQLKITQKNTILTLNKKCNFLSQKFGD